MMGILGPYSPFLVGGVKIASGGRVPSGPFRGGPNPPGPPLCPRMPSIQLGSLLCELLSLPAKGASYAYYCF